MSDNPCATAAAPAPFPDGWPTVPSLTVTRDGRVLMAAPLMNDRESFDVGPYKVWVTLSPAPVDRRPPWVRRVHRWFAWLESPLSAPLPWRLHP